MPVGDLAPELAVLVTAVLVLLLAMFIPQRRHGLCAALALAGLAVAALIAVAQFDAHRLTFSGTFALDAATGAARVMILTVTALCVLLSPGWFASDRRHGEVYAMLLFSTLGAMAMAGAADLMQLVIGLLLSSITSYVLAAYHRDWSISVEAGMKYFLIGALANALMVIGVVLVLGMTGSTGYAGLKGAALTDALALVGLMLVLIGLLFKLGAMPAHTWVPDVAEGAPAPAAAFLTTVPKIPAALALIRLVALFPPEGALRLLIALIAAATMTLGNLAALWQDDVRRLIGWSSVSQAGYALMAVAVVGLSGEALPALIVFIGAYALATLTAFAVVTHLRGRTGLGDYAGLLRQQPLAASALIIAFLSLVGIPPLVGFLGKFALFLAAIEGGFAWLALLAVANSVLSLFYYARVIAPMIFQPAADAPETLDRHSKAVMVVAAAALVLLPVVGGLIWPALPVGLLP
ncbi:NADH-quinone oxidoreductase subunit N [Paracoccus jeotgali]|uniref:NADH-quinone oxidoreductase subunit N n=1 Tax=Paracoccus jeotgali TaxID=2065379 RepID=A0A2K9MDU6_9RHOB|nr:NADH-quinone oxidoreductase subunit N [Paracoccus jeotgali]AUM73819.1 NADH-quinone oxidoreductase subunit L [Paracoccus jeotgali]